MNKAYMITQNDVNRERFNSEIIKQDGTVKLFLNYFLAILGLAAQLNLIDDMRRDKIFELLGAVFEANTKRNSILVTNRMYVFSAWLMSLSSQWEAWQKLEAIIDFDSASKTFEEADKWYMRTLQEMKTYLNCAEKAIEKIDNSKLKAVHAKMTTLLKSMQKYSEIPEFSLKNEHVTKNVFVFEYCFIKDVREISVIETLRKYFYTFAVELQIFAKLGGKNFAEFSEFDYTKSENEKTLAELELNAKFETKMKEAKEKKEKALDKAILFAMEYEKMTEAEQESLPLETLEENDQILIELRYCGEVEKIKREWEVAEKKLSKMFEFARQLEGNLGIQSEMPSLIFAMQEVALLSLCKKGVLNYPTSRMKKGMLLLKISTEMGITEVLNFANEFQLSENEICFLKQVSTKSSEKLEKEVEILRDFSEKIENLSFLELLEVAKENGFLMEE